MGRPKALLEVEDETFFERAVRTLEEGGCREIVVVVDPADRELADRVTAAGIQLAWGQSGASEQVDSLRAGLRALYAEVEAAVVMPVDHPLVRSATVKALIEAYRASGAPVVQPVVNEKRGHPVLFSATVFDELLRGPLAEGARTVVHDHREELRQVEVDDQGILLDIDTPRDYEQHLGKRA